MAKIERYFAQEPLQVSPAPRVPVREIADVGGTLVPEALAGVGEALGDVSAIVQKWYEREGNSEYDTLRSLYQSKIGEFERTSFKDSTALEIGGKKLEDELAKLPSMEGLKNKSGLRKYKTFLELNKVGREKIIGEKTIRMIAKNNQIAFYDNISKIPRIKDEATAISTLETLVNGAIDDNTITAKEGFAIKKRITNDWRTVRANDAIENIKPALIAAIRMGDKTDGYKKLAEVLPQLVKSGILTEPEAAEADRKLGDWMDNYVAGRFKQAKEAEKLTTRQTYQELMPTLFDDTQAQQRYDAISRSKLLKADKDLWYEYIKGSYEDSPIANTPAGHTVSFNAVYDAATLQLSSKEAYDVLLEARFIDRSITDDQFTWAVDKIENPYPKHIIEDIRTTLKSNLEDFNKLFRFDRERNKKVNESLLAWVDEQIKQDKVPLFDFKKKMYAMSSQFRVGDDRWYDIGQIIKRGGVEWEIVGFDEDGEPLVEEVW